MSENMPEPVQREELVLTGARPTEPSLQEEFREFGRQLTALLRAVRETPRAKEIETQVTQAMKEMERQVNEAVTVARQRAQEQNLADTLKGAAQTAADETQRGLARGLHKLNERMAKTVQETEKKSTTAAGGGTSGFGGETPAGESPTDTHYDPGL